MALRFLRAAITHVASGARALTGECHASTKGQGTGVADIGRWMSTLNEMHTPQLARLQLWLSMSRALPVLLVLPPASRPRGTFRARSKRLEWNGLDPIRDRLHLHGQIRAL